MTLKLDDLRARLTSAAKPGGDVEEVREALLADYRQLTKQELGEAVGLALREGWPSTYKVLTRWQVGWDVPVHLDDYTTAYHSAEQHLRLETLYAGDHLEMAIDAFSRLSETDRETALAQAGPNVRRLLQQSGPTVDQFVRLATETLDPYGSRGGLTRQGQEVALRFHKLGDEQARAVRQYLETTTQPPAVVVRICLAALWNRATPYVLDKPTFDAAFHRVLGANPSSFTDAAAVECLADLFHRLTPEDQKTELIKLANYALNEPGLGPTGFEALVAKMAASARFGQNFPREQVERWAARVASRDGAATPAEVAALRGLLALEPAQDRKALLDRLSGGSYRERRLAEALG